MPKVVIDTNVFISMLLKSKKCLRIREAFLDGLFDILISTTLLKELIETVRSKPKLRNIFSYADMKELISLLKTDAELVTTPEKVFACRDPKDNPVLECAIAGNADFIVTGDKDLLALKSFRKIPIITPGKFLKILNS